MTRNKIVLFLAVSLTMLLALAACNGGGEEVAPADGVGEGDFTSTAGLSEALRAAGASVATGQEIQEPLFDGDGQIVFIDEESLQVYEFGSAADAEAAAETVQPGGTMIGTTSVDWISNPHFYQAGQLIVIYVGTDETLLDLLQTELGEPFVTGVGMLPGQPVEGEVGEEDDVAFGTAVVDLASFIVALRDMELEVEQAETLDQPFFEPNAQVLNFDGASVQVFEFPDALDARAAAAEISPDGTSIGTTMMTWVDTPHFYQSGRLIVLYLGDDETALDILTLALGAQVAGG